MADFEPIPGYSSNRTSTVFTDGTNNQRAEFTYGLSTGSWTPNSFDAERTSVLCTNGSDTQRAVVVYNLNGDGSGGSGVLKQYETMPTATANMVGDIVEYVGETTASYTHAFIYECIDNSIYTADVTFTPAKVVATGDVFAAAMKTLFPTNFKDIVSGTMVWDGSSSDIWYFTGKNSDNETIATYQQYTQDWNNLGITFLNPVEDEVISFTCSITPSTASYDWTEVNVQAVLNSVSSTSTTSALSANMGKELQDQINHLQSIGRFLSLWNASTGLAQSNPTTSPYTYKTGDYFIVGTVGSTNYKPNGSTYVIGQASTTVESGTVSVGNIYYYDGSSWNLQAGGTGGGTVTDVRVNGTSVVTNGVGNIPVANTSTLGAVKVDGTSIVATASGVISTPTVRTTVADTTSTTATIASVNGNTDYTFSQALTSLTITAITSSMYDSNIFFTAGSSFALTLPSGTKVIGSTPSISTGDSVVISIKNGMVVIAVSLA